MDVSKFRKLPLMGILRGIPGEVLEPLFEEVQASGLRTVEITMNTKGAAGLIKKSVRLFGKHLMIGAGTVLTLQDLKSALEAGASFIVLPVVVKEVVAYCVQNKVPVFPGALCPQEIYDAWNAGATMVKVFPARLFGAEYFKELKAPFQDIELLACSGVTPENLKSYFDNGASAIAMGSSVFSRDRIETKNFGQIRCHIQEYIQAFTSLGRSAT